MCKIDNKVSAIRSKGFVLPKQTKGRVKMKHRALLKLWKGDNGSHARPATIEVEIFRNGTSYQTVTLSEENHWTYTWSAEDDGSDWKVVERNIPTGYTMTVEERETAFVLTNTFDHDVPKPPETGDTANIMLWVILMIVSGSSLIIFGITGKRNRV